MSKKEPDVAASKAEADDLYEKANAVAARRQADVDEAARLTQVIEGAEANNETDKADEARRQRAIVQARLPDYKRAEELAINRYLQATATWAPMAEPEKRAAVIETRGKFLEALNALLPFARAVRQAEAEHKYVWGLVPPDQRKALGDHLPELGGSAGQVLGDIVGWSSV